jgi:nitrate reductase delta subunit
VRRRPAQTVFGCASVLLAYPEDDSGEALEAVRAALLLMPAGPARRRLTNAVGLLEGMAVGDVAAQYVDTFDLGRRRTLYLTYYRHGDTRERGLALAALADVYRAAGFRLCPGELPDYLPALLELAAVSPVGAAALREHRGALEVLRAELEETASVYADVVAAVGDALGPATRADRDVVRRFRLNGPPSERVGLEPFAPPEVMTYGVTER